MHIIESISKEKGIVSTGGPLLHLRMQQPRPGDVVDFRRVKGQYPFTRGDYGRVSDVGTGWADPDEVHICCEQGSVFLHDDGKVSISGGPFAMVKASRLEPAFRTQLVRFWNWGNNSAGADQGVDYYIHRPVFILLPDETEEK